MNTEMAYNTYRRIKQRLDWKKRELYTEISQDDEDLNYRNLIDMAYHKAVLGLLEDYFDVPYHKKSEKNERKS